MRATRADESPSYIGSDADVAVLRKLTLLVIAGSLAAACVFAYMIFASMQAVATIDAASASHEREQVLRAIAALPGSINAVSADAIANTLALDGARLGAVQTVRPDEEQVPIGPSMVLAWHPRLVGSQTFLQIAPLRIAGGMAFLVIVCLIGWRLYQIGRSLDHRRAQAARLAATDPLTGLANRLAFDQNLAERYRMSATTQPFALVAIDLDGFKAVNDTLGHGAGDRVLQTVAAQLHAVSGPDDCVARIGGDEFFVLRSAVGVEAFIDEVRDRLAAVGGPLPIAASFGVARSDDFPFSLTALTHAADAALYRAKRSGGSRAELAVPAAPRRAA